MRSVVIVCSCLVIYFFCSNRADAVFYSSDSLLGSYDNSGNPEFNNTSGSGIGNLGSEGFYDPRDVAIDAVNHRAFVVDETDNRILIFQLDSGNNISSRTAIGVLGQHNFYSSTAQSGQNGLHGPTAIALDQVNQRLFVSDGFNNRVLVFNVSPGSIANYENADFVLGQSNFTTISAATTQNGLNRPWGLEYDATSSRLFVADNTNNRVLVFNVATGSIANGENADFVLGQSNFTSALTGTTQSRLWNPRSVAYDDVTQRLYVTDITNFRVMIFNAATSTIANGANAINQLGQVNFTTRNSSFDNSTKQKGTFSTALTIDTATSRLFASDSGNNRILVFDVATSTLVDNASAIHVIGQSDYDGRFNSTAQSRLGTPEGMDFDPASKLLYVAEIDNNRVTDFNVDSAVLVDGPSAISQFGHVDANGNAVWNVGQSNSENNNPTPRGLNSPEGMVYDTANHRLFVADYANNRVLVYPLTSGDLLDPTQTPQYVLGQSDFYSRTGVATQNGLWNPSSIALDSANNRLFVADEVNNRVVIFDVTPASMANGKNADHVLGHANFTTQTSDTNQKGFDSPGGLAYDAVGQRLFVQDYDNARVMIFDVAAITDNEDAVFVLGQADFTSSGADLTAKGFEENFNGTSISYDSAHTRLFVGDANNARVLVFNVATSTMTNNPDAIFVLGEPNFTTSNFARNQTSVCSATGILYDSASERLFVGDDCNSRIMAFDVAPGTIANGEAAANNIFQGDYTSRIGAGVNNVYNLSATTTAYTSAVIDLAYDPSQNTLLAAIAADHRIMQFRLVHISTATLPDPTLNSAYSQSVTAVNYQNTLSFALQSGSLPTGLSLNTSSGLISGTPTATGTSSFTIRAIDTSSTGTFFDDQAYSITVNGSGGGGGGSGVDLSVSKTVDKSSAQVGNFLDYTITVTNNGTSTSSGVSVSDTIPADTTLINSSPSVGTYNSGVWTIGSLTSGSSATLTVHVVINGSAQNTTVTNTATATSTTPDPDTSNNTSSAATVVTLPQGGSSGSSSGRTSSPVISVPADIAITNVVDSEITAFEETNTYTITVTNVGSLDAEGVYVYNSLPDGLTFESAEVSQGTFRDPEWIYWTVGDLNVGQSETMKLKAKVTTESATDFVDTAIVASFTQDVNPANNIAVAANLTVVDSTNNGSGGNGGGGNVIVPVCPSGTPNPPQYAPSNTANSSASIVYTVSVVNNGNSTANDVVVDEPILSGLMFVSASTANGNYYPNLGQWKIGTLAPGQKATLSIVTVLDPNSNATSITNTSCAHSAETDSDPVNNAAALKVVIDNSKKITIVPTGLPNTGRVDESLERDVKNPNQRILIPKINVDADITEVGLTSSGAMESPKSSRDVGWYKYSAIPGEKGKSIIAGHLDVVRKGKEVSKAIFSDLSKLQSGDEIIIKNKNGVISQYKVNSIKSYDYTSKDLSEIFSQTEKSELDLITCAGVWIPAKHSYSKRLVVSAQLQE